MTPGGEEFLSRPGEGMNWIYPVSRVTPGEQEMQKSAKYIATTAAILMAAAVVYGQSGEATYKAKCQMCHGVSGMADSPAGKSMKVKPISDADVKKQTEAQMTASVTNGEGKMQAFKGKLTDAQIKDAVTYFRTFLK